MAFRHLHKDYHTTFCGKDASHIPMTLDVAEATCKTCVKRGKEHVAALEAQATAHAEAEALRAKHDEAVKVAHQQAERLRSIASHQRLDQMLARAGYPRAQAA